MNIDIRNLQKWLNEEQEAPIDRQALARVLAMAEQPAQQEPVRSISDEQDAFEKVFKLPEGITRFDGNYAPISYSAWSAQQQCYRWEGWKARAMIAALAKATGEQA